MSGIIRPKCRSKDIQSEIEAEIRQRNAVVKAHDALEDVADQLRTLIQEEKDHLPRLVAGDLFYLLGEVELALKRARRESDNGGLSGL